MDLGCSPVTPRCRRRTQTHYSSPPARPIALRSGIRRRKSGCTGPKRLGTIGNPLNKKKCLPKVVSFQEKGQTLAYAFTYPRLACNGHNAPCTNACNPVHSYKPSRQGTSFCTTSRSGGQDRWRLGWPTSPGERGRHPSYPAPG